MERENDAQLFEWFIIKNNESFYVTKFLGDWKNH